MGQGAPYVHQVRRNMQRPTGLLMAGLDMVHACTNCNFTAALNQNRNAMSPLVPTHTHTDRVIAATLSPPPPTAVIKEKLVSLSDVAVVEGVQAMDTT